MSPPVAFAVAAHPDDIEFMMSGTLLRLRAAGWETHCLTVASGSCGSSWLDAARIRKVRAREAREAARILGARFHPSLVDDLEIFYCDALLRRLAAIVRTVKPRIVLTHALRDYMEDHMNTARLIVTAAFARGMPNYRTRPPRRAFEGDVTVYHALPHGLKDGLGAAAVAESFVDVGAVHSVRCEALEAHRSQQRWLDATQGMPSFVEQMEAVSRRVGRLSGRFRLAEGWCRHNPLGFCAPDADPLRAALGKACLRNPAYARWLGRSRE